MSQRLASQNQTNSNSVSCSWCRAVNPADAKNCARCGAPLHKAERPSVAFARALPMGTRLRGGDYEIQDVIGQGRFGITYRALNQRLNRLVAIKEWFPESCERDGLQVLAGQDLSAAEFAASKVAFLDEARVLARFDHAALVSVFAAWEENAGAYMEMELLHGPTLAQVLERFHHLKASDALRLFAPILDAFEQLHAQNWLHRDFNPQNIVLCGAIFEATEAASCVREARAVVIDFGAARQIVPDVAQEFAVAVTPGYSPLEQYAVRARRGAYCDIYALCATLYHALSGQIPPPAPERPSGVKLVPLRDLAPAVPEPLCRAIASGLEIEIARRPQNVGELRALLPPLPSVAPVVSVQNAPQVLAAPAMPIKSVEKTPQVLAAPLAWPQSAHDATAANRTATKARSGSGWWWIAGPLGAALLMGVLRPRPQVVQEWSAPATRLIDEPRLSFEPPPFAQQRFDTVSTGNWRVQNRGESVSADNSKTGKHWQWKIEEGQALSIPFFAPDESWLMLIGNYDNAVSSGGRVWFFDLQSGKLINVWSGKPEDDSGAGFETFFSPRGRYVGIKRFPNVLRIWEVRTHRDFAFRWSARDTTPTASLQQEKPELFSWNRVQFSPDETKIVLSGNSRNLWLVDLSARTVRQAQVPLKTPKTDSRPSVSVGAYFLSDNRSIKWADLYSHREGVLLLDDFTQKVPVEIIDGATSRPQ